MVLVFSGTAYEIPVLVHLYGPACQLFLRNLSTVHSRVGEISVNSQVLNPILAVMTQNQTPNFY